MREDIDGGVEAAAPIWAAFGDLMSVLLGAFVLILVSVIAVQLELSSRLENEVKQRQMEAQRRKTLEQALAGPLAAGRVTLVNGRIGISGSVLFALNSDQLQPEGLELLKSLAGPLSAYLRSRDEILMVSGFADDQQVHAGNRRFADNWNCRPARADVTRALIDAASPAHRSSRPRSAPSSPSARTPTTQGGRKTGAWKSPRSRGRRRAPETTMDSAGTHARAMLDAWRARGADRLDPVRFHVIAALDRRAAGHSGEARRILDARLSGLLEDYAARERMARDAGQTGSPASSAQPARGALADLLDHIASRAPARNDSRHAARTAHAAGSFGADPELKTLDYFRETWSTVSTERQLRQALDQVPRNAGPLNSSSLVHRSLLLMQELSPAYLRQFLSYMDALSWMEQMSGNAAPAGPDAPRAASAKKGVRNRPR